ncbi:MAG: hypothetical protein H7268_14685 [Sandarakinorhabdus sp.]|nr:hypothetical protein [Sandarakinorhabdus sp.]
MEDTGCGIDEDELAGIFEPFRSGKGRNGSDLGLAVGDNPAVVDVLTELLDGAGVEVGACLEARGALAAIDEDPEAWALLI